MRTTLLLLVLLAGCGPERFYLGPRMPSDEVALLIVEGGPIPEGRKFTAKLVRFDTLPLTRPPKKVEILPREHTVEIAWTLYTLAPGPKKSWLPTGTGNETIAFAAAAGSTYHVVWDEERLQIRFGGEEPR